MNFLAHLYLSGANDDVRFGNFIGDFVKGSKLGRFAPDVALGIKLHRQIDQYTDTHTVVGQSKKRLQPRYRHYAGVIVDIYYDHFLAAQWPAFHKRPLAWFAESCYEIVDARKHLLPERAASVFPYMRESNWLLNYQFIEGIEQTMAGMARRSRFNSGIEHAAEELRTYYDTFSSEFNVFFPQLKAFANEWLLANGSH